MKGWNTVVAPRKPRKAVFIDVPYYQWMDWSEDERDIFNLLRTSGPYTAKQLAELLTQKNKGVEIYTKEAIGDILYDGDIKHFIVRTGQGKDRLWSVKKVKEQ